MAFRPERRANASVYLFGALCAPQNATHMPTVAERDGLENAGKKCGSIRNCESRRAWCAQYAGLRVSTPMPMKLCLFLLVVCGTAFADDAALLRCRAITDATARLACYDALAVAVGTASAAIPDTNAAKPPAQATSRSQPSAPQPPAPQTVALGQDKFGLEDRQANREQLNAIESSIAGSFEGWNAKSVIRLTNGQAWQISDDSSRAHYIDNPKVRIRRGALGAFYLEIQGTNSSPRVKRVQ